MGRNIREYEVFKLAHKMVLRVYEITKKFPPEEKFGLSSQMRRAAYSIPMNLNEGGARQGENEFRHFVNIAIGSCAEMDYQIDLAHDLKYMNEAEFNELKEGYTSIGKMLTRLMQTLVA